VSEAITRLNAALEGRYRIESELAAVVGAERFLAEIKTTANLQHPHILPLFDSGEADSFLFYVMPHVEGESLRDRIDREKQLPVDEAVRIATAVANALHHAHERGVIHRDIKPADILIQDGEPLIADFGIALAVGAGSSSRLTETGLSLGTPYYMSPEQATEDQEVGPASDIYALAAVLYEILTGDPPYVGSTAQAVLSKILQGAPVSATAIRKSIPVNVDAAIKKSLEKLPADRFTSAQGFAKALEDPGFRYAELATVGGFGAPVAPWNRLTVAFAALSAVATAALFWSILGPESTVTREPARHAVRMDLDLGGVVPDPTEHARISPDGAVIVIRGTSNGTTGLHVRSIDGSRLSGLARD
jgi:serine/threonine-protein kinase